MSSAQVQVVHTTLTDLGAGPATDLLLQNLAAFLTAVREHPITWRLVLLPPEGAQGAARPHREGACRGAGQLTRAVRLGLRVEKLGDAELTARLLSVIADEYVQLVLTDPDRCAPDRLLDHARWWLAQPSFGI